MLFLRLFLLICLLVSISCQMSRNHRGRIPESSQSESGHMKSSLELRNELKDLQIMRKTLEDEGKDTSELAETIRMTIEDLHQVTRSERDSEERPDRIRDIKNRVHRRDHDHDPRQSRHDMEQDKEEKFHNLIKGRIDGWLDKIEASSSIDRSEKEAIKQDINEYYQLELKLIQSRSMIAGDFEKARLIRDKDDRRKFLDSAKEAREIRRIEDNRIRDIVIQKREFFRNLVVEKTGGKTDL